MTTDRRSFMKTGCLAGLCACLGPPITTAAGAGDAGTQTEEPKPPTMPQKWIVAMLPALAEMDKEQAKRILKSGARAHFEHLDMAAKVESYRGKMDGFLDFLRGEWDWVIAYDRDRGVIEIDENKSACVCPLVPKDHPADLGVLCYCSEGFAEKLFSAVAGTPVRAEVVASIRRGQKSCKYRIELKPAP
jgi:predicted hydrocarbon binding protein